MSLELVAVIAFLIIIFGLIFLMLFAGHSFAPWVPSSAKMAQKALDALHPPSEWKFADLGCGDGRIVFLANRRYGMTADGFEISLVPYFIARLRSLAYLKKPVSIRLQSLFSADLKNYDIVYIYGLPGTINKRLTKKLTNEMKTGAYVISYNFSIANKKPITKYHDRWRNVYVYQY